MKVNFQFKNKFEVVDLEDFEESFHSLQEKCSNITNEKIDNLSITFFDVEDEQIQIKDESDFEYLKSNIREGSPLQIKIENSNVTILENEEQKSKTKLNENENNIAGDKFEEINKDEEKSTNNQEVVVEKTETENILQNKSKNSDTFYLASLNEREDLKIDLIDTKNKIADQNNDKQSKEEKELENGDENLQFDFETIQSSIIIKKAEAKENLEEQKDLKKTFENESKQFDFETIQSSIINKQAEEKEILEEQKDFKKTKENENNQFDFETIQSFINDKKTEEKENVEKKEEVEDKIDFNDISVINAPLGEEEKKKLKEEKRCLRKQKKIQLLNETINKNEKLNTMTKKLDELQNILESISKSAPSEEKEIKKSSSEFYHENVKCDNCLEKDFGGKRYKCMICENFDICEKCENLNVHKHPMMVIRKKINGNVLASYTDLVKIRNNFLCGNVEKLKRDILINITENQYPAHFYDSMILNYQKFNLGDFILEIIKIFA